MLVAADRLRTLDGGAAEVAPRPHPRGLKGGWLMKTDNKAILARVEQIVEFLRKCHVRDGWKIDEERAERALSYFRRHMGGPAFADEDEDTAAYHSRKLHHVLSQRFGKGRKPDRDDLQGGARRMISAQSAGILPLARSIHRPEH